MCSQHLRNKFRYPCIQSVLSLIFSMQMKKFDRQNVKLYRVIKKNICPFPDMSVFEYTTQKFTYNFYLVIEVPDHVYVLGISSSISDCCISIFRFSWCCLSYSDFLPPSAFRAYTCEYVARVKVIASRKFFTISATWFAIHVSSSAAVTSRFLTTLSSEHTPPKTYTCHIFSVISENIRTFSLWPLIVLVIQVLKQSRASLSVGLLTNFQLLYKHNNDTEPDVSYLNTYAYKWNTFGWKQKLTFKKRASYI